MQACGPALAETVAACIGDLKSMAMVSLYHPLIYIIQIYGADAMPLLAKPLTKLLHVLLTGEVPPYPPLTALPLSLMCTAAEPSTATMEVA